MIVQKLTDFVPDLNPFTQDHYHMGSRIGKNVTVMFRNHNNEHCPYLIVINEKTGERIKITFPDAV